jgi:hypothetical protein
MTSASASVLGSAALIACALFLRTLRMLYWLSRNGQTTQGVVIWDTESISRKYGISYQPTVQFKDERGAIHQFKPKTTSAYRQSGQIFEVKYDRNNPEKRADVVEEILPRIRLLLVGLSVFGAVAIGMFFYAVQKG